MLLRLAHQVSPPGLLRQIFETPLSIHETSLSIHSSLVLSLATRFS
jgi:hypothetical protein